MKYGINWLCDYFCFGGKDFKNMKAKQMIKRHEGWMPAMYTDSTGHSTIGYGFNLEAIKMPKDVGDKWLSEIIEEIKKEMNENYSWFHQYSNIVQAALIDMRYNLGKAGFGEFKQMLKALSRHNRERAAHEALDSLWANQVPNRACDIAAIIRGDNHNGI